VISIGESWSTPGHLGCCRNPAVRYRKPHNSIAFERQLGRFDAAAYSSLADGEGVSTVGARMEAMADTNGFMLFAVHDDISFLRIAGLMGDLEFVTYYVGPRLTEYAASSSCWDTDCASR
jgi:hypothetical protein